MRSERKVDAGKIRAQDQVGILCLMDCYYHVIIVEGNILPPDVSQCDS